MLLLLFTTLSSSARHFGFPTERRATANWSQPKFALFCHRIWLLSHNLGPGKANFVVVVVDLTSASSIVASHIHKPGSLWSGAERRQQQVSRLQVCALVQRATLPLFHELCALHARAVWLRPSVVLICMQRTFSYRVGCRRLAQHGRSSRAPTRLNVSM